MTDQLMTAQDVADRAQVSPATARRWIASGDLPSVKLGKGRRSPRRVRPEDFAAFVASRLGTKPVEVAPAS